MKDLKNKIASLKNPKVLGLIFFALIVLIGLPITLYEVSLQQNVQQHASVGNEPTDSCGLINVTTGETPTCGSGTKTASYSTSAILTPKNAGATYTVNYYWESWFCATKAQLGGPNNPSACLKSLHNVGPTNVTVHGTTTISSGARSPDAPFSSVACGIYQNDFSFSFTVNGQTCTYGNQNTAYAWGYCNTGVDCAVPSTTPTPSNTPTPTVPVTDTPTVTVTDTPTPTTVTDTPTDTPTPEDTDTPTPSDTPTGTITPTDTPTETPTGTLTPTATSTPGPTNTPGPSSTPTNTPAITLIAQKPTLPPTGPENDFIVNIGIVGAAVAVVGAFLLFIL